jgi:hypothetical protein
MGITAILPTQWPLGDGHLEAPSPNGIASPDAGLLLNNSENGVDFWAAGSAMDHGDQRQQRFFGKLLGITVGLALIAVAFAISQYWVVR